MEATHYFTFVERELALRFFAEEPVMVRLPICAENDRRMDELPAALKAAADYPAKRRLLCDLLGQETADALLARADRQDDYAAEQLLLFLHRTYLEERTKNLRAAAAGWAG